MNIIIEGLTRYCNFADTFNRKDHTKHPISEMGYMRADHDGRQWWTTAHPVHEDLYSKPRAKELDSVTDAIISSFKNLDELESFCVLHAEDLRSGNEYNLYFEGQECNYWIRAIIRRKDYNLYIHAFCKTEDVIV